ncbi:hypothetical protein [Streptomyces huasconensis]|uniref:hypothetical protein n=1 Tax=Streptomyces huasconensis TaxID=1854574 RepID=UPI003703221A
MVQTNRNVPRSGPSDASVGYVTTPELASSLAVRALIRELRAARAARTAEARLR